MEMKQSMIAGGLLALVLSVSCLDRRDDRAVVTSKPTETTRASPRPENEKPVKPAKKQPARDIQGFRVGMNMQEVKQLLAKKGIREYETGFSDFYAYSPSFGAEIALRFTCGATDYILSTVELSTKFSEDEADRAVAAYWDKLVSKYGAPTRSDAGPGSMDLCWGQCEQTGAWRLDARTTAPEGGTMRFSAALSDASLVLACGELRRAKIDRWLNRWIADARKFTPGMDFRKAAAAFWKRYQDRLTVSQERDTGGVEYSITNFVATDHEYFAGLDYEASFFEGEGPGEVILKFTGDQAGAGDPLNRRLYYTFFSTTKFTDKHLFSDIQGKLDRFTNVFGDPVETRKEPDRLVARWVHGSEQRVVVVEDSGLISLEQSDLALQEAYRDAAVRTLSELDRKKFDQDLF